MAILAYMIVLAPPRVYPRAFAHLFELSSRHEFAKHLGTYLDEARRAFAVA